MERIPNPNSESANPQRTVQAKFTSKSREGELDNSPMMVAQRKQLQSLFGGAAQLKGPEEEPFQAKHALGEEEFLPGKYGVQQHKGAEEEPLQGKSGSVQRAESAEKEELPVQGRFTPESPVQREPQPAAKPNYTGLPDNLKSGIESLSGMSMDSVKVHYNSPHPAQLNALAYARGTDIHVAPGQEQHLPHEAWHVVQQAQNRVKPTMQMKDGVPVNDDKGLENEADVMGAKAVQMFAGSTALSLDSSAAAQRKVSVVQMATPLVNNKLNVVGEDHPETEGRLAREKRYTAAHAGSSDYWTEGQFQVRAYRFKTDWWNDKRAFADPFELRFNQAQQFLAENAVIIGRDGNLNKTNDVAKDNLESQAKFISNLWIYLWNLSSSFFKDQADGFELSEVRKGEMLGYRQQIRNIAVTWQAARVSLAAARHEANPAAIFDWTGGGVAVTSEANARANFKRSVDDLSALNIVNRTADELSEDRSDAMHIVANNRSAEPGVWKIGDAHRADIAGKPVINYNLVSRVAFNADYNVWPGV